MASDKLLAMIIKCFDMKYLLLIISICLIIYPLYAVIECLQAFGDLTNYGVGVLTGGLLMISLGSYVLYRSVRLFKKKV